MMGATRPAIALQQVGVTYGQNASATLALAETTLMIAPGEFVALVGPSGCGKSTILKLVGGLLAASQGIVLLDGREQGAQQTRIGIAFQNATLLPWLNIRQNIMLPLKIVAPFRAQWRAQKTRAYRDRVEALLAQVGLAGQGARFPWQLSGGMQQRAALCRALVHDPSVLLLDEPFAALDAFTREELWAVLQELWIARRPTVVMVTHDLREAAFLASRIMVMSARPGRIIAEEDVGFAHPRNDALLFNPDFVRLTQTLHDHVASARDAKAVPA